MSCNPTDPLQRQVASLVVVRASGSMHDSQRRYPQWELNNAQLQDLLQRGVGGVILLGGSAVELQQRTRQLRRWSEQPLLLCADVEEGVGQRFEGGSWLVPPLALARLHARDPQRSLALAQRYGQCTGEQAKRCGLNWVLGPVCDVNNNPDNPVINVRAWGEEPETVAALASAFQRGLSSSGVLGCAKHFPGHGDTTSDSHLDLPVLPHNRARLDQLELPPFKALIEAGVDSVMTAHLLLPQLDPQRPATLSRKVLNDLLRRDLEFNGLVVTDALVMEAITRHTGAAEAAVLAFEAGADLILMPADAAAAISGISQALSEGRIPLQRLQTALQRRREALERCATADDSSPNIVDQAHQALEQELVQASLQLHPSAGIPAAKGINLIRIDSVLPCPALGGQAPALHHPQILGYQPVLIHPQGLSPWRLDPEAPLALELLGDGPVLLQIFLRGNPFRGERDRREPWRAAVRQLQDQHRLAGLVVYGSPYVWEQLKSELDPAIPAAYSPGQMPEAQQQVLQALLQGKITSSDTADFTD